MGEEMKSLRGKRGGSWSVGPGSSKNTRLGKLPRDSLAGGSTTSLASSSSSTTGKHFSKATPQSRRHKQENPQTPHTKELFRTDFINAMRLNDTDILERERCLRIIDHWRHEWNTGVQTPLDMSSIKDAQSIEGELQPPPITFKFPKKLLRLYKSHGFSPEEHSYRDTVRRAEGVCRYDMDEFDVSWLNILNEQRVKNGFERVEEAQMETIMEILESRCHEEIQEQLLNAGFEQRGREYDADAVCDVCFHGDTWEEDEIVFCDRCDLAVHQSCYGVVNLPSGQWLCRACSLKSGPVRCILCPNRNGAFKCTRTGERWAHVSCVWWIPEVKFEDCERMEPIINVSKIPADRWNLKCVLCQKKEGACIQCTYSKCTDAYHVTCAQRNRLFMEMKTKTTKVGEEYLDLQSFCSKHTLDMDRGRIQASTPPPELQRTPGPGGHPSPSRLLPESPIKRKQRRQATLESSFYLYVNPESVAETLHLPLELVQTVFEFWKLKRRARGNGSLVTPKEEESELLEKHEKEVLSRRVKVLLALRQNLEKARNLAYMIQRRERLQNSYVRTREEQFEILRRCCDDKSNNSRSIPQWLHHLNATSQFEQDAFCDPHEIFTTPSPEGTQVDPPGVESPSKPSRRLDPHQTVAVAPSNIHTPKKDMGPTEASERGIPQLKLFSVCDETTLFTSRDRNYNLSSSPKMLVGSTKIESPSPSKDIRTGSSVKRVNGCLGLPSSLPPTSNGIPKTGTRGAGGGAAVRNEQSHPEMVLVNGNIPAHIRSHHTKRNGVRSVRDSTTNNRLSPVGSIQLTSLLHPNGVAPNLPPDLVGKQTRNRSSARTFLHLPST